MTTIPNGGYWGQDSFGERWFSGALEAHDFGSGQNKGRVRLADRFLAYELQNGRMRYGDHYANEFGVWSDYLDSAAWGQWLDSASPLPHAFWSGLPSLTLAEIAPVRGALVQALRGGLGYAEIADRLAPLARSAGLGVTAQSLEVVAQRARAAPRPTAAAVAELIRKRDSNPEARVAGFARIAGMSESDARALAGDAHAAEWKAREAATRVALGWPQPLAKPSASVITAAAFGKAPTMRIPTKQSAELTHNALIKNMMATPVMQSRAGSVSASVSGTTETGLWILGGLGAAAAIYFIAKRKSR